MEDYMSQFNDIYAESDTSSSGGGGNYTTYELKNHQNKHNIVRLVGAPRSVRRAWITVGTNADGSPKKIPFSFSKDSILEKIIKSVLDFEWINKGSEEAPKWEKKYKYESSYGDVFKMVRYNGTDDPRESGWEGSQCFPFNCIDREDSWCQENKHTKLLVKSDFDVGMSAQAFKSLKNSVIADYGPYQDYDIDIKKIVDEKNQIVYSVAKAQTDLPEFGKFVVQGPLSEEEKAYVTYDLDALIKDSSARMILKYLKDKIKKIDEICRTSFIKELETLSAKETIEYNKTKNASNSSSNVKYEDSGLKTSEGYSYSQMKEAGWTDEQLLEDVNYKVVVKVVEIKSEPPKAAPAPKPTPKPTPKVEPPKAVPTPVPKVAPTPTPTPKAAPVDPITVDGFTYSQMKEAGWTDEQLLEDPKWAPLVVKPSVPKVAQPPKAAPAPKAAAPAPKSSAPSSSVEDLPCPQCEKPYAITLTECPFCGYKDNIIG